MATVTFQAGQAWHQGLKIRKHLLKQLEKLQDDGASGVNVSQFETVNGLMEKFRFACVHTIFLDFEYAVKENAEEALWGLHTSINAEYRRALGRLKPSSHAVERRKVEKMYHSFLRIAQQFYKGYIQRLSARYDVQELRRAARGIYAEQSDAGDVISPVPAALSAMVVESCHSTLLRLGDLARYRTQAKHRGPGYERALTYYSLARDLVPQSGFAFHQMGIVNLDQANHLDVVYHFYRAWAVEVPHPNAKSNLETEFKSLRLPNAAKARPNPSTPQDAFNMWFTKLHALFYKGEDFSQQKELEEEVRHRLEMACRNAGSGNTLLKMALVNMSAYEIASSIFAETRTKSAWRFCQFALRFNALFAMTFCGALKSELQEAVSNRGDDSSDLGATQITSIIEGLLPTLRVYSVWLAAHRHELFSAADTSGAVVPALMQNLVKVFTLLCIVIAGCENLASCPYLLPEDLEVRGLRTLTGDQVPRACRVGCEANGNTKPHVYDPERRLDVTKESMARILDTLRCAYFLAEDGSVPVTCQVVESWLVFEYRPPDNEEAVPSSAAGERLANQSEAPAKVRPAREEECSRQPAASGQDVMGLDDHQIETPAQRHRKLSADEEHAERTVISMLTPFLKPPTPQPQRQVRSDASSSYGMHTVMANDVFALTHSYASPTAPMSAGPIAPLPWAWDNTPKPSALASAGKEAFHRASRDNSPRDSMTARTSLDDPFTTPGHDAAKFHAQAYFGLPVTGSLSSPAGLAADQSHREHLLQSLTSTTTVPRTSPFAQWEEQQGAAASSWGVPQVHRQMPTSTSASSFSHPSSLYMSTPADGLGLGVSGYGVFGRSHHQSPTFGADASSSAHRAQLGDSALSYDDAIFRAAWMGN